MISDMERLMLEKARIRRTVHSDTNLEEPVYGIYTSFTLKGAGEFQKLYSYIKPPQKNMYDWSIQVEEFLLQKVKIDNKNKAVIDNSILSVTAFFGIIEKVSKGI